MTQTTLGRRGRCLEQPVRLTIYGRRLPFWRRRIPGNGIRGGTIAGRRARGRTAQNESGKKGANVTEQPPRKRGRLIRQTVRSGWIWGTSDFGGGKDFPILFFRLTWLLAAGTVVADAVNCQTLVCSCLLSGYRSGRLSEDEAPPFRAAVPCPLPPEARHTLLQVVTFPGGRGPWEGRPMAFCLIDRPAALIHLIREEASESMEARRQFAIGTGA